ncbi:MAG: polyprenyl synthetase family protein [Candidatus Eisenbacteria bacterium]|uniref:Polyprenyl synthetase family protein n=1 Tax=Eiseniibacteriota bacterium TaxID=2212470 RepID=A0A538UD39_UNCEI|nr:MAG: polyprenyl synthetase family protein [Candidatus Eisenbacteria bacterium]
MSAVQKPVRRELERVQTHLRELFRTPIPILNEVGGHVLATRGKKFRPTLLLLTARLRGHLGREAVLCATVVEMVHAAALIHDDSVDKSGLRRGLPTVNGLWTDEMAIIMGDYLYAQAMATLVTHKLDTPMGILARVVTEMSCGEALEFQYAYDLDVTEAKYEELIRAKTGSLIGAATEIGAGLNGGGADRKRRSRYRRFGETVGLAFQIIDDLFDYLADPEVTGKPSGSDLAAGKVTLPLIAALRQATEVNRRRLRRLALRKRWTADQWRQLRSLIEVSGGFEYARARALMHADAARRILDGEPEGAARTALDRAIDYAVGRDH